MKSFSDKFFFQGVYRGSEIFWAKARPVRFGESKSDSRYIHAGPTDGKYPTVTNICSGFEYVMEYSA